VNRKPVDGLVPRWTAEDEANLQARLQKCGIIRGGQKAGKGWSGPGGGIVATPPTNARSL
jgi:hypothetical protein